MEGENKNFENRKENKVNNNINLPNNNLKDHVTEDFREKILKENRILKSSLKELHLKEKNREISKKNEVNSIKKRLDRLLLNNKEIKRYNSTLEEEIDSLKQNNKILQNALKNKIRDKESNEEIMDNLEKINDPEAIVLINKLLENLKIKENNNSSYFHQKNDNKEIKKFNRKIKHLEFEKKEYLQQLDTMKTQNDFLVNQLNFAQKKLTKSNKKTNVTDSDEIVYKICEIFGITDERKIEKDLLKIKKAYEYLPSLQETVERIYTIITEESCIPMICTSNTQLVEIIENWASNLTDYQNLVHQLFEVLQINDEALKNRTYLIESIKELVGQNLNGRSLDESRGSPNDDLINEISKLKKGQNTFQFFIEEAKNKLNLPAHYSNEALFSKVLKNLKEEKRGEEFFYDEDYDIDNL